MVIPIIQSIPSKRLTWVLPLQRVLAQVIHLFINHNQHPRTQIHPYLHLTASMQQPTGLTMDIVHVLSLIRKSPRCRCKSHNLKADLEFLQIPKTQCSMKLLLRRPITHVITFYPSNRKLIDSMTSSYDRLLSWL